MPIYMQFGGIHGDVETGGQQHWIEIYSFQWGVGRGISSPTGGSADRESSLPSVSEIVVTKDTDATSPNLYGFLRHGSKVVVHVVSGKSPSAGSRDTITLHDALITGIEYSGGRKKHEKVTIRFSNYHFNGIQNIPVPPTLFCS